MMVTLSATKRSAKTRQVPECLAGLVFYFLYSYLRLVDFNARVVQRVIRASCTAMPRCLWL